MTRSRFGVEFNDSPELMHRTKWGHLTGALQDALAAHQRAATREARAWVEAELRRELQLNAWGLVSIVRISREELEHRFPSTRFA